MARYLSDEWFDDVGAGAGDQGAGAGDQGPATTGPVLVLAHVVTGGPGAGGPGAGGPGGPGGETRYHVRISGGTAEVVRGEPVKTPPDATFTEDYATAAAVASGALSTAAALLAGRIRVAGDMATLVRRQAELSVEDPVPPAVRAATVY